MGVTELIAGEKAQSEWSSLYMIIVLIIAALLLIALVKPMFNQSRQIVRKAAPGS